MQAAASALTLALATANVCASAPVPELLVRKLRALSGADAQDCGSVPAGGDRAAAIACAQRAQASATAYRLTVELQGGDFSWQGAARTPDGTLWVVFFGTDAADPSAAPSMSLVRCREIRFATAAREDVLECIPSIGGT